MRDLPPQQDLRRRESRVPAQGSPRHIAGKAQGPGLALQQRAQLEAIPRRRGAYRRVPERDLLQVQVGGLAFRPAIQAIVLVGAVLRQDGASSYIEIGPVCVAIVD